MARGDPPEGEAVRQPCGPEEDGIVCASHWRGHLAEAIEEEEDLLLENEDHRSKQMIVMRRHNPEDNTFSLSNFGV